MQVSFNCSDANKEMSVEEMAKLIENAPPGPWHGDWAKWPNVIEAHKLLLQKYVQDLPDYPQGKYEGKGIVVSVNAKSGYSSGKNLSHGYFPGAYVLVKELRRLGCDLPILFTYLGPLEWDPRLSRIMKPLGVECVDLKQLEKKNPMRILAGWETKIFSIIHSPWKEIIFLDADNVPVLNPDFLFTTPAYLHHGAIFWKDLLPYDRNEWLPNTCWHNMGMEYHPEVVDSESGQLVIDKEKCWKQLQICKWINEHSDFTYKWIFGDKSTFTLAWWKWYEMQKSTERLPYAQPAKSPGWNGGAILQYDFSGRLLFEHCAQNKPNLYEYPKKNALSNWGEAESHLEELQQIWEGRLWYSNEYTEEEKKIVDSLSGKTFIYRRIGLGERNLTLLKHNRVGKGTARCERFWSITMEENTPVLSLISDNNSVTALLKLCSDGVWRGSWLEYEKCECELDPLPMISGK